MHPTGRIKALFVINTLCSFCTCNEVINRQYSLDSQIASEKFSSEDINYDVRCSDLFERSDSEHILQKYWMLIEQGINPHYLHKCIKYYVDILVQLNQKKTRQTKIVVKRDADSDEMNKENKASEAGEKKSEDEEHPVQITTASIFPEDAIIHGHTFQTETNSGMELPVDSESKAAGLDFWVYIVIGIAVVIVIIIPLTATLIYYRRRQAVRHQSVNAKASTAESSGLMYDTQRSGSTDKGTERSKSTVSTYLSKDSRDSAQCHELVPLKTLKERSSVIDLFQDTEVDIYEQEPVRCREYDGHRSSSREKVINISSEAPFQFQTHLRTSERQSDWNTPRLFSSRHDDVNRLHGGNIDSHKRNVDMDFEYNDISKAQQEYQNRKVSNWEKDSYDGKSGHKISFPKSTSQEESSGLHKHRPMWQLSRNESKSSSSTRSYISIPPTSPSENYIEAGLDDIYMPAEHSTPLTKMAWLTKIWKGDAKNELSNYQACSGTQTDSDTSITGPNCKTVFGTPWQFGGTFNSRGGVMQAKDSDVCLVVVPNAVPKGEYVDIYGAIFTDTTEIRKRLSFSATESLITPVVEYHAVPATPFRKPVCVQLPHALPEEFDISLIRVYTFTVDEHGKVTLHNIPASSKTNSDSGIGQYWEKGADGHSIDISTFHFSGYFCTQCETTSWPSICTMVFGSHVQITQSRREVRVILYIWDRRLTIKDYLERFRKQESDVDRQLLTDMQVPLLDSASSSSRLVMCMDVMGADDDRQSWRHILRPDGSRPLFKPLQVRKLSEIVHCCRQTDPIRVEWAVENVPDQSPSAVFQCCIDIMHVHESTRDYETALREDSDDLMRTFYVRDLKVMTNSIQEPKASGDFQRVDLKRTLSETMDITQTERMCQEFGISIKDIGNFRKKYSTSEAFQCGLVEECLRRYGSDKFVNLLPKILERLNYSEVLTALGHRKILQGHLTDFRGLADATKKTNAENDPHLSESLGGGEDSTIHKSPYRRSTSQNRTDRSLSPHRRKSREYSTENQRPDLQQKERSGDVLVHSGLQINNPVQEKHINKSWGKENRRLDRSGQYSPPNDISGYNEDNVNNQNTGYIVNKYTDQSTAERQQLKTQKSSYSGGDSVLGSRSEPSRDNSSTHFSSRSSLGTSMFAHADPKDFAEPFPNEFLDDSMKQTYKKELLVNKNVHDHYLSEEYTPYQVVRGGQHLSSSGPHAIPPQSGQADFSSISDPVPPYQKLIDNDKVYKKPQSADRDQTLQKELYGINTVV